jgi:hypothetical protein
VRALPLVVAGVTLFSAALSVWAIVVGHRFHPVSALISDFTILALAAALYCSERNHRG